MNKFIGLGRLTKDGELGTTESGKSVYTNSIALRRNYDNKDGNYDSDFLDIQAWGATGEFINKYFKKGNLISLDGHIETGSYEKDGKKYYTTRVRVENVEFVESKKEDKQEILEDIPQNIKSEYEDTVVIKDEDLPF